MQRINYNMKSIRAAKIKMSIECKRPFRPRYIIYILIQKLIQIQIHMLSTYIMIEIIFIFPTMKRIEVVF